MKEIDESKTQTLNEELEKRFKQEREEWCEKITGVVKSLKDYKNIMETQVIQLSYRQMVVEKIIEYKTLCGKRQESYDKLIQKRNNVYDNQSARKLSAVDKKMSLTGDYASLNRQIKLIENQILFFEETIKTLDNMGYSIKNQLTILTNQLI